MQNIQIETETDYFQMMRDMNRIEFTLPEERTVYHSDNDEVKNEKVQ